jgi:hypothetical protein
MGNPRNNSNTSPQRKSNWSEALWFCFGTWQRALITFGVLIVLALSGVIVAIVNFINAQVIMPLLVLLILLAVVRYMMPRKGGH